MSEFKFKYKFQWVVKGEGPKTAYFYAESAVDAKAQFKELYGFEPNPRLVTITRKSS